MEFKRYAWYNTSEHNLMRSLLPWKMDMLEYGDGVLLEYSNGQIVFDQLFYYNDNIDRGRGKEMPVKRFMIISL